MGRGNSPLFYMKAREACIQALEPLGKSSEYDVPDNSEVSRTFTELRRMLSEWRDDGIQIGGTDPQDDDQELGVIQSAEAAIVSNLAVRMADVFRLDVPARAMAKASKTMAFLKQRHKDHSVPSIPLSSTLPKGQGNPYGNKYFNKGDRMGGYSPNPNADTL